MQFALRSFYWKHYEALIRYETDASLNSESSVFRQVAPLYDLDSFVVWPKNSTVKFAAELWPELRQSLTDFKNFHYWKWKELNFLQNCHNIPTHASNTLLHSAYLVEIKMQNCRKWKMPSNFDKNFVNIILNDFQISVHHCKPNI